MNAKEKIAEFYHPKALLTQVLDGVQIPVPIQMEYRCLYLVRVDDVDLLSGELIGSVSRLVQRGLREYYLDDCNPFLYCPGRKTVVQAKMMGKSSGLIKAAAGAENEVLMFVYPCGRQLFDEYAVRFDLSDRNLVDAIIENDAVIAARKGCAKTKK